MSDLIFKNFKIEFIEKWEGGLYADIKDFNTGKLIQSIFLYQISDAIDEFEYKSSDLKLKHIDEDISKLEYQKFLILEDRKSENYKR